MRHHFTIWPNQLRERDHLPFHDSTGRELVEAPEGICVISTISPVVPPADLFEPCGALSCSRSSKTKKSPILGVRKKHGYSQLSRSTAFLCFQKYIIKRTLIFHFFVFSKLFWSFHFCGLQGHLLRFSSCLSKEE